jgi:hypothetical protein
MARAASGSRIGFHTSRPTPTISPSSGPASPTASTTRVAYAR